MLVYSRVDSSAVKYEDAAQSESASSNSTDDHSRVFVPPAPPARALDAVRTLNAEHDKACESYTAK